MSITMIIVVITVAISLLAFNNNNLMGKLILWPSRMTTADQHYRMISSGFIHADWGHLFFNMFTLFFIGKYVEQAYAQLIGDWQFVALYLLGIVVANIPTMIKKKNQPNYRSLGASGGVAAVLFSMVYFGPWDRLYIWFLPMPAILFAVLYLIYSAYMAKRGQGYINHDAHLWGSVFGFIFTLLMEPSKGALFLNELKMPAF